MRERMAVSSDYLQFALIFEAVEKFVKWLMRFIMIETRLDATNEAMQQRPAGQHGDGAKSARDVAAGKLMRTHWTGNVLAWSRMKAITFAGAVAQQFCRCRGSCSMMQSRAAINQLLSDMLRMVW